jgi:hypothetical protein
MDLNLLCIFALFETLALYKCEMKGILVKSTSVHAGGTVHFYSD